MRGATSLNIHFLPELMFGLEPTPILLAPGTTAGLPDVVGALRDLFVRQLRRLRGLVGWRRLLRARPALGRGRPGAA